jgi:hypothetical protein
MQLAQLAVQMQLAVQGCKEGLLAGLNSTTGQLAALCMLHSAPCWFNGPSKFFPCDNELPSGWLLPQVFKYAVHGRFGYLTSACLTSRLQLAALYAASSTLLPEPASQLTGAETALVLVRHSWTNVPLTPLQQQHLRDAARLGGFQAPVLRLLCHDLAASASQHLHVPEIGARGAARRARDSSSSSGSSRSGPADATCHRLDPDAVSEYMLRSRKAVAAGFPVSPRQQLTAAEETWLMHTGPLTLAAAARSTPYWKRQHMHQGVTDLPQFPVASDYVQQAEAALMQVVQDPQQQGPPAPFPVPPLAHSSVPVADAMMAELQDSWRCYQQHPEPTALKAGALEELTAGPYALVSTPA